MSTEAGPATLDTRHELEGAGHAAWFPCFDGLRAIAALSVFGFHTATALGSTAGWAPGIVQDWLARLGGFGVAMFFVISGFLLYRPFVVAHFRGGTGPQLGKFWIRRFARIAPAYWLALTVTLFVILPATRPDGLLDLSTYYGFVQNYRSGYQLGGIVVAWTLVIELSFYLVLPAIAWAIRGLCRADAPPRTKLRAHVIALVAILVIANGLRAWQLWISPPGALQYGRWQLSQLDLWLPGYLDWFAVGMLGAVASAWIAQGGAIPRVLAALGRRPWLSWLLALETYAVIARLRLPRAGGATPSLPLSSLQHFSSNALFVLCAAFVVAPAVFGRQEQGGVRRMLRSAPFVGLGLISYGIYLWHAPMWLAAHGWQLDGWMPFSRPLEVLAILAMTLAAATLSFVLVERPIRIRAQRLTRRSSPVAPPMAAASLTPSEPALEPGRPDPPERGPRAAVVLAPVAIAIAVVGIVLPPRFHPLPGPVAASAAAVRPIVGTHDRP